MTTAITKFRPDSQGLILIILGKIIDKNPLIPNLLRYRCIFDPGICHGCHQKCFKRDLHFS